MPLYNSPYGQGKATKKTGFSYAGATPATGVAEVNKSLAPTLSGGIDPFHGPGAFDMDMTDPIGSAKKLETETGDIFTGLKAFLFGTDAPNPAVGPDSHGGLIGDVPGVGAVARFGSEVVGNVLGAPLAAVGGGALDVVGGALEHVPNPLVDEKKLREQFDTIPDDFVMSDGTTKQAMLDKMEADKGFLGTGAFSADMAYMSQFTKEFKSSLETTKPDLFANLFTEHATVSDLVTDLFGTLGWAQRLTERGVAGWDKADGNNQLDNIMAVGSGHAAFTAAWGAEAGGLTPAEQQVYDMYSTGKWTENEALDYMASHGLGISHSKPLQIAGSIALDPLNLATLGAGALAKFGKVGASLLQVQKEARAMYQAERLTASADRLAELEKLVEQADQGIKSVKDMASARAANRFLLGRVSKTKWAGDSARKFGEAYVGLAGTTTGRVAKGARTMIDPLHLWGDKPRTLASLDEGSRKVAQAFDSIHGEFTTNNLVMEIANAQDLGVDVVHQYEHGVAVYAANTLRRVVSRNYQATQIARGVAGALVRAVDPVTGERIGVMRGITDALASIKRPAMVQFEEEMNRFRKFVWSDEDKLDLAKRLNGLWGKRSVDDWLIEFKNEGKYNADTLSALHASTYGSAVTKLHDVRTAVREAIAGGEAPGLFADRLDDIILVNRNTLTDFGAEGILERLAAHGDNADAYMAEIESAMARYPALSNFVIDSTSPQRTLENFTERVKDMQKRAPAQIRINERPNLNPALRDFDELISGDQETAIFTIGFKPKEEFRWGIEQGSDGVFHAVGDPWFDQVSDGINGYHAVRELSYNAQGLPLAPLVSKAARMLDSAEAAGKTLLHGTTGAMVTQAAHARFTQRMTADFAPAGMSKGQAEEVWSALQEASRGRVVSSMRGLGTGDMWDAAKGIITKDMEDAGLDRRHLLMSVLEAFDGDARQIGYTQKFTGRAKIMSARLLGGRNSVAEVAEHVWPLLKFKLNPLFQLQEKVEPWVLNGQRGADLIVGAKAPTEADVRLHAIYKTFVESNIVNFADEDIAELAARMQVGKSLEFKAMSRTDKIGFLRENLDAGLDVQAMKRLNMFRTFKKGLAKSMRQSWDESSPGEWDRMVAHHRVLQGGGLTDEDDFAVFLASENAAANNVLVRRMYDKQGEFVGWQANFEDAIRTGQWSAPHHIGELPALHMDSMVLRLGLRDSAGGDVKTLMEMKEGLAGGTVKWDDIRKNLKLLGAHDDYVNRVQKALYFNWNDFWKTARTQFSLSDDEVTRMQFFYERLSESRGMTPAEYMSQLYEGKVLAGDITKAVPGGLGEEVAFLRGGRKMTRIDLTQLVGAEGQATAKDMFAQMAAVTARHLDPSSKLKFLEELLQKHIPGTEGQQGGELWNLIRSGNFDSITVDQIDSLFFTPGVQGALADRVTQFAMGAPGTGVHAVVTDATEGVKIMRDGAAAFRARAGRPRSALRVRYDDVPELEARTSAAFEAMPKWRQARPHTAAPPIKMSNIKVRAAATGMDDVRQYRPEMNGLARPVQTAYMEYNDEAHALYKYMTDDMGVTVSISHDALPYADASALRADLERGRLKVSDADLFHPLLMENDVFITRAVEQAFGYGQEAVEFGSHDGVMSAMAMYGDNARSVALTDSFGRMAWERNATEVVPHVLEDPRTFAEAEARWGATAPAPLEMVSSTPGAYTLQTRTFGHGIAAAPPDVQDELFGAYNYVRNHMPQVPLDGIEIADLGPGKYAVAHWDGERHITITLDHGSGWNTNPAERMQVRNSRQDQWLHSYDANLPLSPTNRPSHTSATPAGDFFHEFGHALDVYAHKVGADGKLIPREYITPGLTAFMRDFKSSDARKLLSHYANAKSYAGGTAMGDAEGFAELFDLAINPENLGDLEALAEQAPELYDYAIGLQDELRSAGLWTDEAPALVDNVHAGAAVGEANRAGAGIRAEHRVGRMPQDVMDDLTGTFLGTGRYAESNPDVARMAGFMRKHITEASADFMENEDASQFAHMFEGSGFDLKDAVPFDFTQAKLWNGAMQSMADKWTDAFRLQYFAQNRSMLQRSINHPMFGLYPASYMWGKIGPEIIKFIALEPFGVNTGAGLRMMYDLQMAVATQRMYDPAFDAKIEELGHSAALSFLGYLLPATPWSVPASFPAWARDLASQGQELNDAQAEGRAVHPTTGKAWGPDLASPITSSLKKIIPMSTNLPWVQRAGDEVGDFLGIGKAEPPAAPAPAPAAKAPDLSAPTSATGVQPVLENSMAALQRALGGY